MTTERDTSTGPEPLHLLYVEDNPADVKIVRRALERTMPEVRLEVVPQLLQAKAALTDGAAVDLVLADMKLPDGTAIDLLAWLRRQPRQWPVVVLAGSGDQEVALAALKAGSMDYLVKRGDYLERLPAVLRAAWAHFQPDVAKADSPLRVLYAEDNAFDADLTRRHLARHAPHLQLEVVTSGHDVLDRLAAGGRYDILMLDYQLPGLGGLELSRRLKTGAWAELPVVLITGQGSEELVAEALQLGVADYLIKSSGYLAALPAVLEKAWQQGQLRREQSALRASEARFRGLFEGIHAVMLLVDPETGAVVDANPAAVAFYGWSREVLRQMTVFQINTLPEDGERQLLQKIATGVQHSFLVQHRRADGSICDVEIFAGLVPFGDRRLIYSIVHDVTAKRQAEARLRLSAAALASSRDAVVITDLNARILAVNPAFTEITGYAEAEVVGQTPRLLSSGRQDADFYREMWSCLQQSGSWQGEIWDRRKNGETFPLLLSISTVYDEEEAPSHYVAVITDLTRLRKSEELREQLAHYDALTGLPNRLLLEARLQHSLEREHREHDRVAVLLIDLDEFKTINDSFGLTVGDSLLREVAHRLQGRCRAEDTLARMGGDQFVLVLDGITSHENAERVARELQALLGEPFALAEGFSAGLRASIGISVSPEDGLTGSALLQGADTAVHQAKERGAGQICYYASEFNTRARANLELEAALRKALEERELVMYYQPKVELGKGRIAGAEALVRWQRPGHGLVPPNQFIPLAEKSGLIEELGAWVLTEVCRQLRAWQEAGLPTQRVAVNVSARQFRSSELEGQVARALADHGIEPGQLMLEITESMLMDEPEEAVERLQALRRTGVHLALDDFGTGYSSLRYLGQFAIDQLKIDRSFVNNVVTDPRAATIASSIIALAHRMRLGVVAEGVETEAQLGYLRQQGCDEVQGYYFSRPVPAAAYADLVQLGVLELPTYEEGNNRTLLVVDDDPHVLAAIRRSLADEDYTLLLARGAAEGFEFMARQPVQVVLSDQRMPEMDGTEFLGRVKAIYPGTVRLILTGSADLETVMSSVNVGALYKFLAKPWDDDVLRENLRDAFLYYDAVVHPRRDAGGGI